MEQDLPVKLRTVQLTDCFFTGDVTALEEEQRIVNAVICDGPEYYVIIVGESPLAVTDDEIESFRGKSVENENIHPGFFLIIKFGHECFGESRLLRTDLAHFSAWVRD